MDRHTPDRTGDLVDAGTSAQTEDSLGTDVATAQEKQPAVSYRHHSPATPRHVYAGQFMHGKNVSSYALSFEKIK